MTSEKAAARRFLRAFLTQVDFLPGATPRQSINANMGLPLAGNNFGVAYLHQTTWEGESNRLLSASYSFALGKGSKSAAFSPRRMASGPGRLNYDLYVNSSRTTLWGGSSGTQTVAGSATILLLGGTDQDNPVYGRIPGGQSGVQPGTYTDTVYVTVPYQ